jgi:hypothetical protein
MFANQKKAKKGTVSKLPIDLLNDLVEERDHKIADLNV